MRERVFSVAMLCSIATGACDSSSSTAGHGTGPPPPAAAPLAFEVCGTIGSLGRPDGAVDAVTGLSVSRDGRRLVAGRWSDHPGVPASLWEIGTVTGPQVIRVGSLAGMSFEFSPGGDLLAAAGDQRGVYRLSDGAALFSIDPDPEVPGYTAANTLRFSPDGAELASGEVNRTVTRRALDGRVLSRWPSAVPVPGVAYSPDGTLLASSVPELWRIADGRPLWSGTAAPIPAAGPGIVEHFAEFSPDGGTLLVSSCTASTAIVADCQTSTRLFRVSDGTLVADLGAALSRRPRFSADGRRLLAGARVMDLATRATIVLPVDAALSVYLPDGRIAAAERTGAIRLLCPAGGR
jgi:WD40 repeat protein